MNNAVDMGRMVVPNFPSSSAGLSILCALRENGETTRSFDAAMHFRCALGPACWRAAGSPRLHESPGLLSSRPYCQLSRERAVRLAPVRRKICARSKGAASTTVAQISHPTTARCRRYRKIGFVSFPIPIGCSVTRRTSTASAGASAICRDSSFCERAVPLCPGRYRGARLRSDTVPERHSLAALAFERCLLSSGYDAWQRAFLPAARSLSCR